MSSLSTKSKYSSGTDRTITVTKSYDLLTLNVELLAKTIPKKTYGSQ